MIFDRQILACDVSEAAFEKVVKKVAKAKPKKKSG